MPANGPLAATVVRFDSANVPPVPTSGSTPRPIKNRRPSPGAIAGLAALSQSPIIMQKTLLSAGAPDPEQVTFAVSDSLRPIFTLFPPDEAPTTCDFTPIFLNAKPSSISRIEPL